MVVEILTVASIWFWLTLIIVGIVISEMIDEDHGGWATVVAIATIASVFLFTDFRPLQLIANHLPMLLGCIVGYFVLGTGWGVAKWWFWLNRTARKCNEVEARVRDERKMYATDDLSMQREIISAFLRAGLPTTFPVQARQHKAKITGWMVFWPCSMIWTLLNDPVRRLFDIIYGYLGETFQSMSNSAFANRTPPKNDH